MKRSLALGTLAVLAIAIVVYSLWRTEPPEPLAHTDSTTMPAPSDAPPAQHMERQSPRAQPEARWSVTNDEQAASLERGAFHERARAFFAEAPALEPEERAKRALEIEKDIDAHEASSALSAGEAFVLRSALIRETVADPDLRQQQQEALADRYRQDAGRRIASATRADPEFELYKAREAEIVAQVLAMDEIPDGLSRDEYLRRRLQSEREALLGDR